MLHFPALATAYEPILEQLQPNSITIIGEQHQHTESVDLIQTLVTAYLQQGRCLILGLEITSDQQPVLDRVMQGKASASDIKIHSIIDHPPFRKMINNLANLSRTGTCLSLIALDASFGIKPGRDQWMAQQLADRIGKTPILALLGGLHTLKQVNWDLPMKKHRPSVSAILLNQKHRIQTYPQYWKNSDCVPPNRIRSRFILAEQPEALTLLNNGLIALLNAFPATSAVGVVNGFIIWECQV